MPSWLTIIGIGEDGLHGLSQDARDALYNAEIIYGGQRHLKLISSKVPNLNISNPDILSSQIHAEMRQWPTPFLSVIDDIKTLYGKKVVVLASGDPLFHGVGNTLIEYFDAQDITIYYQPSSYHLALQRMAWSSQNVECISLVGKPINTLKQHVQNAQKLIILAPNAQALAEICDVFEGQRAFQSKFTILESLGGEREKTSPQLTLEEVRAYKAGDLYVIAVECYGDLALSYPVGTILPDTFFESDGQLTKHSIRAMTLAHLAPHNNQLLWDIGAGSGSIAIEWLRAAPRNRAFAVEKNKQRANRIKENANNIGVIGLTVFEGNALNILKDLEAPDAIFIGGGFTDNTLAEQCWNVLKPGGRFVANGVTLETEAAFQSWVKHYGGELIKLSIAKAEPLGGFHVWRQALPVTILVAIKN